MRLLRLGAVTAVLQHPHLPGGSDTGQSRGGSHGARSSGLVRRTSRGDPVWVITSP
jgi:hypothetical protein